MESLDIRGKVIDAAIIWDAESMIEERIGELLTEMPTQGQKHLEEASAARVATMKTSLERLSIQENRLRAACQLASSNSSSQPPERAEEPLRMTESLTTQLDML
jgi:hypothetical protein